MKIPQCLVLVVFTCFCATHTEAFIFEIWELISVSKKIFSVMQDASKGAKSAYGVYQKITRTNVKGILQDGINHIINQISELDKKIDKGVAAILKNISAELNQKLPFYQKLQKVIDVIDSIDIRKNEMFNLYKNRQNYEIATLENFADNCIKYGDSQIDFQLEMLHKLVFRDGYAASPSLLSLFLAKDKSDELCKHNQSEQQLMYDFFESILVNDVSGALLTSYSYDTLRSLGLGNYTEEVKASYEKFNQRILNSIKQFIPSLNELDTEMRRCESSDYRISGEYLEMGRLIQGYIAFESCFYPNAKCAYSCKSLNNKSVSACGNIAHKTQGLCKGKFQNCERLGSHYEMCPYKTDLERNAQGISRFYDHFYTDKKKILRANKLTYYGQTGQNEKCHTNYTELKAYKIKDPVLHINAPCDYCFCTCENPSDAVKYISLEEVNSDVESNKVVTGLRFKITNQILHIEIKQGVVTTNVTIKPGTSEWKSSQPTRENSAEIRAVDTKITLCNLKNTSSIITGLQFVFDDSKIYLKGKFSLVNRENANVIAPQDSDWYLNQTCANNELKLKNPGVPFEEESTEFSKPGDFVGFTHSDHFKDGAQYTVPFIDAQEVVPNPDSPLSGVGLYHRGQKGYYGFLALKVFTYRLQESFQILKGEAEKRTLLN